MRQRVAIGYCSGCGRTEDEVAQARELCPQCFYDLDIDKLNAALKAADEAIRAEAAATQTPSALLNRALEQHEIAIAKQEDGQHAAGLFHADADFLVLASIAASLDRIARPRPNWGRSQGMGPVIVEPEAQIIWPDETP